MQRIRPGRNLPLALVTGIALLMGMPHTATAAPPSYSLTDIGGFGAGETLGYGLNNHGQIVGYAAHPSGKHLAFVWTNGTMTALPLLHPGDAEGFAGSINDAGDIAGGCGDFNGRNYAAMWHNGVPIDISPAGYPSANAGVINNSGVVGVNGLDQNFAGELHGHPYLWSNGVLTVQSIPNATSMGPLNDVGHFCGHISMPNGDTHGYLYREGVVTDLGTLPGLPYTHAGGINRYDQVTGSAYTQLFQVFSGHAFLWSGGVMLDLGTLGGAYSYGTGINDQGQVVGFAHTGSGAVHAFLYQNGSMLDLNSLIPSNSGVTLTYASMINQSGQIVAQGAVNGITHTFLLTPAGAADTTPPQITVPADQVQEATGPGGAVVSFSATAVDDQDGAVAVTCVPASGSTFPLGATTVTCTATDHAGNTATSTFQVRVVDTTAPTLSAPADVVVNNDPGNPSAVVTLNAPTATDLVDGSVTPAGQRSDNLSLSAPYPVGSTVVTWTAVDHAGNSATVMQRITVRDVEPPKLTIPGNLVVTQDSLAGATVNFTVSATDNCAGVTVVTQPGSGSVFPLGTTTVTSTATDASGNTTTRSFTVTVVAPANTPSSKVTGGGSVAVTGGQATFGMVEITNDAGQLKGQVTYQDPVTGRTLKSTVLTALVVNGTHARIFGEATLNGSGSYRFIIDVDDLAEPGGGVDRFTIQISDGYAAGGTVLSGGNIQIH